MTLRYIHFLALLSLSACVAFVDEPVPFEFFTPIPSSPEEAYQLDLQNRLEYFKVDSITVEFFSGKVLKTTQPVIRDSLHSLGFGSEGEVTPLDSVATIHAGTRLVFNGYYLANIKEDTTNLHHRFNENLHIWPDKAPKPSNGYSSIYENLLVPSNFCNSTPIYQVWLGKNGYVHYVDVLKEGEPLAEFAGCHALVHTKFDPAYQREKPVFMMISMPVKFEFSAEDISPKASWRNKVIN